MKNNVINDVNDVNDVNAISLGEEQTILNCNTDFASSKITILTLNCCLWAPGIRATRNSALKEERCASSYIPRIINMADITLCQEVLAWSFAKNHWISAMKSALQKLYTWIPQEITDLPIMKPYHLFTSGLWTVVNRRFSILFQQFIYFKHSGIMMFEYTHPIGFLHTVVSTPNSEINVINVHMLTDEAECCLDSKNFDEFFTEELNQLVAFILALGKGSLWVIGGDFNVDPGELIYKFVEMLSDITFPETLYKFHPICNTCNENISFSNHSSRYKKVDHFYSNMEISSGKVLENECSVSDHLPVMVELTIPSKYCLIKSYIVL